MKRTIARLLLAASLLAVALPTLPALAQVGVRRDPTATVGHVDCTTTSATLLLKDAARNSVAFTTTSGSGIVYINLDATNGATTAASAATNTFAIGGGSSWDDGEKVSYTGGARCASKSGTVTVFYEVK